MNTKKFKNIILFQVFLTFALAIKDVFFPYSLAPEELTKAIIAYDGLQPLPDLFTSVFMLIFIILSIISLIMLFKLKKFGRTLYSIAVAGSFLIVFSGNYFVYDPLELFIESGITLISGLIIGLAYFSNINKSFK